MPQQQPTSLLLLPDELLVRIILDCRADAPMVGIHPVWPLTHVCHHIRNIAQAILYRKVDLNCNSKATPHMRAIIEQNPSPGQLVHNLTIFGTDANPRSDDSELLQAVASAASNLKVLILFGVTTEKASSVLGDLPSASLWHFHARFRETPVSIQWRGQIARFSKLRDVVCQDWSPEAELVPRTPVHPKQPLLLPELVRLHITDYTLIEAFGAAGPLRRVLPSLRKLENSISQSQDASTIRALISKAPLSLEALKLLSDVYTPIPRQYLPALPALRHLTHLELGSGTFIESKLLVYLPTAPLKSIRFDIGASVTDRILQALTGPGCPPQLHVICLDHIEEVADPNQVRNALEDVDLAADMGEVIDEIQREFCPEWPNGGTEHGLRFALATASANGLEVTGSALTCLDWEPPLIRCLPTI